MSTIEWPRAVLDPIRRAKVIAAALPSAAWSEATLEAPFERVWPWITDFERSVPRFDSQVSRIRVRERQPIGDGVERVALRATTLGFSVPFDVRVENGFCLMRGRARLYLVVMAAMPDGDRTRFFHLEAVPLPGGRALQRVIQREVNADLARLARLAAAGFPAP